MALRVRQHDHSAIGEIVAVKAGSVKIRAIFREGASCDGDIVMNVPFNSILKVRKSILQIGLHFSSLQITLIKKLTKNEV